MTRLTLIAIVARNGVIGHDNQLLWRLPEDQRYFRRVTQGHVVIMGRRTWDSLPERFRPLPGRRNIVVTRQKDWQAHGAEVCHSPTAALALVADSSQAFVIGGADLYAATLPLADELLITEIERDYSGDTRFPPFDAKLFVEVARERHHAGPPNDFEFSFVTYQKNC
jgi:dihydrofolate reductase